MSGLGPPSITPPPAYYVLGPVGAALILVTAAIALAIGAGLVPWSYWWLLVPGVPASLATFVWVGMLCS